MTLKSLKLQIITRLFFICIFTFLTSCTTVPVKPSDQLSTKSLSTITLIDKQQIRSNGFEVKQDQLIFSHNGEQQSIPVTDIHKITSIERWNFARKSAVGGAAVGTVGGIHYLLTASSAELQAWGIITIPAAIGALYVYAGVAAYIIGNRTIYEFNPLELNTETAYSAKLQINTEKNNTLSSILDSFHLGINIGGGYGRFPRIEDYTTSLGQDTKVIPLAANLELGKWVDNNTIWGVQVYSSSAFDGDENFSANRGTFSIGPQIIYFPYRYGLYYKGSATYTIYYEDIEDLNNLDNNGYTNKIYEKNLDGIGIFGSIGYVYPITKHINISTELMTQAHYISNNNPIASASLLLGLHWY